MGRGLFSAILRFFSAWRYALLVCAVFLFAMPAAGATPTFEDVSSQVSITRGGLVLNRATNTFDTLVQVTNTSGTALSGPLVLSVSSINPVIVTLSNAAGQDPSGNPYVNVAVPTGGLPPGQSIANILLKFSNPNRVAFTFFTTVFRQVSTTNDGTTIQDATGGTVSVADPDNPNSIVSIAIPPGVLGTASDTISVSFSSTSPGPLNASATAAGAHFVSRVITLTRASGLNFIKPIQVTIPYGLSQVGPNESMIVVYWDSTQNGYDVVHTVGIDGTKGTITFETIHFTLYQAVAAPLTPYQAVAAPLLLGSNLVLDPPLPALDTGFRALTDGFYIDNISTMTGAAAHGACFGLTAFAKWFYQAEYQPSRQPGRTAVDRLAINKIFGDGTAAEGDVARELFYWSYEHTQQANENLTWLDITIGSDLNTADNLLLGLLVTNEPQLVVLSSEGSYTNPTSTHSVLVYSYSLDTALGVIHFNFYDPNAPLREQQMDYIINAQKFFLPPYTDVFGRSFNYVYFSALSDFTNPIDLTSAYSQALNGWPDRHFKEIVIDPASSGLTQLSVEGPDPVSDPAEYEVLPGSTTLQVNWTCSCPPSGVNQVFAHIFFNGSWKQDVPIQAPGIISGLLGNPTPFSYTIPADIVTTGAPEMIIIISRYQYNPNTSAPPFDLDYYLSNGYEGFLRVKLKAPLYQVTEILMGAGAEATDYPGGTFPYTFVDDRGDESCYTPDVLPLYYPSYYAVASSLHPFSANVPVVCVSHNNHSNNPAGVPPLISPIFSDSYSASFGSASATANFQMQFSANSISASGNAAWTSVAGAVDAASTGARVGLTIQVYAPVHYHIVVDCSPSVPYQLTPCTGRGVVLNNQQWQFSNVIDGVVSTYNNTFVVELGLASSARTPVAGTGTFNLSITLGP